MHTKLKYSGSILILVIPPSTQSAPSMKYSTRVIVDTKVAVWI